MNQQCVTVRRLLRASREEVFDAWLDAGGMRAWMRPGPVTSCEVMLEPRVGGCFRIVMQWPGGEIVNTGEFLALERPNRLQFTWISSRWAYEETLVTVELHDRGKQCELVLTHDRFPEEYSAVQLAEGWNEMLERFDGQIRAGRG